MHTHTHDSNSSVTLKHPIVGVLQDTHSVLLKQNQSESYLIRICKPETSIVIVHHCVCVCMCVSVLERKTGVCGLVLMVWNAADQEIQLTHLAASM